MKIFILLLISISVYSQECKEIKSSIERLECYDARNAKEINSYSEKELEILSNEHRNITIGFYDPDAAKFRNEKIYKTKDGNIVCGEVNGKNGFGAYLGYKKFFAYNQIIKIRNSTNSYNTFDNDWLYYCSDSSKYSFIENYKFKKKKSWYINEMPFIAYTLNISDHNPTLESNFVIHCMGKSPRVGLQLKNKTLFKNRVAVYVGLGKDEQIIDKWRVLDLTSIQKLDSNKKIAKFIDSLRDNNYLSLDVRKHNGSFYYNGFDINGVNEIIDNIKKNCPGKDRYWR